MQTRREEIAVPKDTYYDMIDYIIGFFVEGLDFLSADKRTSAKKISDFLEEYFEDEFEMIVEDGSVPATSKLLVEGTWAA